MYNDLKVNVPASISDFTPNTSCEPGWSGTECLTPNYIPKPSGTDSYYADSAYDQTKPNWCGSKFTVTTKDINGNPKEVTYWLGSILGLGALPCWSRDSAIGIGKFDDNGKFNFLGYISDGTNLTWGHNVRVRMQCTEDPKRCALTVLGIAMKNTQNKQLLNVNPNPTTAMCNYHPPVVNNLQQISRVGYVPLQATDQDGINAEIIKILENFEEVTLPGFTAPLKINRMFKFINFNSFVTKLPAKSVNPELTRYSGLNGDDNYAAHIPDSSGIKHFAYWLRAGGTQKGYKDKEVVNLYTLPATNFPWDPGIKLKYRYTLTHSRRGANIEDPVTMFTDSRLLLAVHGSPITAGANASNAGLIKQFNLNNTNNYNVLNSGGKGWGKLTPLYDQHIAGIQTPTDWRQRPDLNYKKGVLQEVCTSLQWPGRIITKDGQRVYSGTYGASRYLCVDVAPTQNSATTLKHK